MLTSLDILRQRAGPTEPGPSVLGAFERLAEAALLLAPPTLHVPSRAPLRRRMVHLGGRVARERATWQPPYPLRRSGEVEAS
ncbi:hypothetical protein Q664_30865 [Archangium violaceum Cb vi76]|uniref:Uncharacterized protein n=1 Tax=Archangium violaceum Cb vi76 TaxID=1406225 RepID=A0A084SNF8_9BACT|nr:hypothetical protein Q664_30865 [Archangium violaceum Cb vi76]